MYSLFVWQGQNLQCKRYILLVSCRSKVHRSFKIVLKKLTLVFTCLFSDDDDDYSDDDDMSWKVSTSKMDFKTVN